ncbi:S8 family serine peptidase [Kitasatospora sp. NPDC048286]|uniref:S8 family serine peptidase n=1 Tax=Kitasatospora sp. NPDC048286 TaxID=3364047 RepID=UPI00372440B0
MTGRRWAGAALAGALLACAAPPAGAATPAPGAPAPGAPPAAAPVPGAPAAPAAEPPPLLAQTRQDVQKNGCLKPSERPADTAGWAQAALRPEDAWPLSRGAGVTVAVVGSGVDAALPALAGRLQLGPRLYGTGDAGRDCVGYGTFAAALVAGRRTADTGPSGLAPEARVLAVAVTDDAGATTPDLLGGGIRAAVDKGARVIAVEVPVPGPGDALGEAVKYAAAHGALVVAPAAPDGRSTSSPVFPASYPGVLAVASTGPNGPSGGGLEGRVDLAAPGEGVTATGPGGGLFTASGPGCATAHVAGAAALVLALRPELTPEQLTRRLEATAYHPGTRLPDAAVGYGVVDPVAAVTASWPAGARAADPGSPVRVDPGPDRSRAWRALAVAGGSTGVVLLVAFGGLTARLGRRRAGRAAG